jgi:site-specific DNA-methyltransferase (adenine-specific)
LGAAPVTAAQQSQRQRLGQYFTPRWAAEAIVERYFPDLQQGDVVVEPSCGDGRFLLALPDEVEAIGVELDPVHAARARELTGRQVITGDFCEVDLPGLPKEAVAIVGNPPFAAATVASFLERSHALLRDGGRCGFILPAYILQTSSKVMALARRWSISTELMPRNLFPGLSLPITFTVFTKSRATRLSGFFLYAEAADVARLKPALRELVGQDARKGSVWRAAVNAAFDALGSSTASLADLYAALAHRPAENRHCEQQVRKVLQTYGEFVPVERGVWSRRVPSPFASQSTPRAIAA